MKLMKIFFSISLLLLLSGTNIYAQVINEVYSRGVATDPDWVEIYNNTSLPLDISGYKIYDSGGQTGTKPKKLFASGTIIPAYGYTTIVTDDTSASGFGISSSGEWLWFENASGTVIDSILVVAMGTTESHGRRAHAGTWKLMSTITKGRTNIVTTSLILPQFIQGLNGTNNNRVPYICRIKIDNMAASTTYKYINQVTYFGDGATTSGAGNIIFLNQDGSFTRTSSTSFTVAGQFGLLTTDTSGSYTGWFITEPTGNATRFVPGNHIFIRVRMTNGNGTGDTLAVNWATTADSIRVINFTSNGDAASGTGIYGRSGADPKDFIFLYDNVEGTGRPLSGSIVEVDGLSLNLSSTALFYRDSVDNINGAWGTIIPNLNANGVRRIERRLRADGAIHPVIATDPDGTWPSGANTVNPVGGLTAIRITFTDAAVPVELASFSVSVADGNVNLNWSTATETNNRGFEVERKSGSEFVKIGYVEGKINSTSRNNYNFTDKNAGNGVQIYRLKQIDLDGTVNYSNSIEVDVTSPEEFSLAQNFPNPFNPSTMISYKLAAKSNVNLKIFDVMGNEVAILVNEAQDAGSYSVTFNANNLASGIYFYQITAGNFTSVKKLNLIK